jgi:hypothetical protein
MSAAGSGVCAGSSVHGLRHRSSRLAYRPLKACLVLTASNMTFLRVSLHLQVKHVPMQLLAALAGAAGGQLPFNHTSSIRAT